MCYSISQEISGRDSHHLFCDYVEWWVRYGNNMRYFTLSDNSSYSKAGLNKESKDNIVGWYGITMNSYAAHHSKEPIVPGYEPYEPGLTDNSDSEIKDGEVNNKCEFEDGAEAEGNN